MLRFKRKGECQINTFNFYNPVKLLFGKNQLEQLHNELPYGEPNPRVLTARKGIEICKLMFYSL